MRLDHIKHFNIFLSLFISISKKCAKEAEAINVDENLLQLEITAFPVALEMVEKMEPIEQLWKTAYKFDKCHEIWLVVYFTIKPLN